jgi:hypothetical protein
VAWEGVGVARADLDNGYIGLEAVEESRGRGAVRTVDTNLEYSHRASVRTAAHVFLRFLLGVTGEQDAGRSEGEQCGDGVVVRLFKEPIGRRGDDVYGSVTPIHLHPCAGLDDLRTFFLDAAQKGIEGGSTFGITGEIDGSNLERVQNIRQPAYVVGVSVGGYEAVEHLYTPASQKVQDFGTSLRLAPIYEIVLPPDWISTASPCPTSM